MYSIIAGNGCDAMSLFYSMDCGGTSRHSWMENYTYDRSSKLEAFHENDDIHMTVIFCSCFTFGVGALCYVDALLPRSSSRIRHPTT